MALLVLGAVVAGLAVYGFVADMRAALARRRRRQWEAHVAAAVAVTETPIHDQLVAEATRDIDRRWQQLNEGGATRAW